MKANTSFQALAAPSSAQGQIHGLITSLCSALHEGARWKQFAHYAFMDAQSFIIFIPCLCPNESREQGWNGRTPWRPFLVGGELGDADNRAAAAVQSGQEWGSSPTAPTPVPLPPPRLPAARAAEPGRVFWANETPPSSFWTFISWCQLWNL